MIAFNINLTWAIFAAVLATVVLSLITYKLKKQKLIAEQVSIQCAMLVIKAVILIHPAGNKSQPFLYVFGFLMQLLSYQKICENYAKENSIKKIKMLQIVLFVYFTMQQYYYRSSHRERFSSLQIGKVCPGRGLCNEDLEWVLVLLDVFGAQIVGFLLLPIFTLNYLNLKNLTVK